MMGRKCPFGRAFCYNQTDFRERSSAVWALFPGSKKPRVMWEIAFLNPPDLTCIQWYCNK